MFNEDKISLTEATVLALQGKLKLEETRPTKKINKRLKKVESVNVTTDDVTVSTDEDGNTTVETDKEIVTVSQKTTETDLPLIDEPIEDNEETIDVPVDGDETIIPEEEVSEETIEDIIDKPIEDNENTEEDNEEDNEEIENLEIDESKKIKKESLGDKNQFSFSFTSETQFGSQSNTDAKDTLMELQEYFQEYSDEIAANKMEYLDDAYDMQTVATMLYQANRILEKSWLGESKKPCKDCEKEKCEGEKVKESKKLQEWMEDDYDFKQFLAYEIGNKSSKLGEQIDTSDFEDNEIVNYVYDLVNDRVDYIINEAIYKCKEQFLGDKDLDESKNLNKSKKIERILVTKVDNKNSIKTDEEKLDSEEKAKNILKQTNVFKKGDKVTISDDKGNSYKLQKESKSSINYNKKSFEEALTKFYKFNSEKVESFNLESIAQNRKGDLKIEGKLNNKVPVTMIFNKKVEGKLFNRYTLISTNNILKESKDITTNLMIAKNGKTFECRYIVSK